MFAEDEAELLIAAACTPGHLAAMVERRASGLPLEQVIGWAEFCGRRIAVEPGVFVPRHRTELLVREAAALGRPGAVVLDLCCGTGALGAVVAALIGPVDLHAVDIDAVAVRCARGNLASAGATVYEGDLFEPLPGRLRGRVDLLLANVPYVPTADIEVLPREARVYEPRIALDGGDDGLVTLRRVAHGAPRWLAPGGHLLVETTESQVAHSVAIIAGRGLRTRVARSEELEATVVIGTVVTPP